MKCFYNLINYTQLSVVNDFNGYHFTDCDGIGILETKLNPMENTDIYTITAFFGV